MRIIDPNGQAARIAAAYKEFPIYPKEKEKVLPHQLDDYNRLIESCLPQINPPKGIGVPYGQNPKK